MKQIGNFDFPESPEETKDWQDYRRYHALASRVIAVARTRIEGTWQAFIDSVPGENHRNEMEGVFRHGCTVPEAIAIILFDEFEDVPYAKQ